MSLSAEREDAVGTGKALVKRHFLHHVCHDHDFKDEKLFYRFLDDEPTEALNTFTKCEHEPRPGAYLNRAVLIEFRPYLCNPLFVS